MSHAGSIAKFVFELFSARPVRNRTLLIDQEMVYTPRQSNDRLLLGLKGSFERI
jgi:hypothetical protein